MMRLRFFLYSDEGKTLREKIPPLSPAHHCLNAIRQRREDYGRPGIDIFCDEPHVRALLDEAHRYCPAAVPRIAAALNATAK